MIVTGTGQIQQWASGRVQAELFGGCDELYAGHGELFAGPGDLFAVLGELFAVRSGRFPTVRIMFANLQGSRF